MSEAGKVSLPTPERIEEIKRENEELVKTLKRVPIPSLICASGQISELLAALEEAEKKKVELWECEDCGFSFNAIHTDEVDGKDTGEYSCPLCAESRLEKELAEAQQTIDRQQQELEDARKIELTQDILISIQKEELEEASRALGHYKSNLLFELRGERIKLANAQRLITRQREALTFYATQANHKWRGIGLYDECEASAIHRDKGKLARTVLGVGEGGTQP